MADTNFPLTSSDGDFLAIHGPVIFLLLSKQFMTLSLSQKLKIRAADTLLTINAPEDFIKELQPLPVDVSISTTTKKADQVHWFVVNKKQLDKELKKIILLIKPGMLCWIYYPKGTSGLQTDLTRDKGWEELLKHTEFQWVNLISFNKTWSAFGFRLKSENDKMKPKTTAERPVLQWIDPVKKMVNLPPDFKTALQKNKKATLFFETLSFTNKKEYVEWIVTAKKEETRNERISASVEKLEKGWKNPRNI